MGDSEKEDKKRRTSITKAQRQTAVATDLIALCQTVTEDGHLEAQEVVALRQWLEENRGTDLPAVAFLLETVERILADGVVSASEAQELYRAIESVLPLDIRESVRGTRVSRDQLEKEAARKAKEAQKVAQLEERARNTPVDTWDFMVAGVWYEGRPEAIRQFAEPDQTVYLVRDRANAFSRNAVEVRLSNGMHAGYVPEELAADIAPLLNSGHRHSAHIKKILTGGRVPIPVIVASLYTHEADRPEAVLESQVPAPQKSTAPSQTTSKSSGCLLILAALTWITASLTMVFVR